MLAVSYCIFHKRERKIIALISSKARAGIAALTCAVGSGWSRVAIMKSKSFCTIAGTLALVGVLCGSARADTFVLSAIAQGWILQTGTNNGTSATNNFFAGNCSDCLLRGEFRNFFEFNVPVLNGPIVSASLVLFTGPNFDRFDVTGINLSQDPTGLVYQVTSLSSLTFADLGTGTVYGFRTYTAADEAMALPITLDADALTTAIGNGGITFSVSGRVISGATLPLTFGPTAPDEFVFGGTEGAQVLSITTVPVPGPIAGAGLPSLILASGGLLAWWRRRQKIA
jgi:hypothetical protein